MALWNVYSTCVKCKYRAPLCSRTTVGITCLTAIIFILPFNIAFRTQGFWLKEDVYREQPDVRFKYEYLFIAETDEIDKPIICSSFPVLEHHVDHCLIIKVREVDNNKDGLNDILYFELQSVIPHGLRTIQAVTLMLIFDYKLYSHSHLHMEGISLLTEVWAEGGRSLEAIGELRIHQTEPLWARGHDARFNSTILPDDDRFDLHWILSKYSARSVTTRLENVYKTWKRGRDVDDPFLLSMTVAYPEDTVLFRPDVWHVLKMAWVQYLALLVPFYLVGGRVKRFILDAQIAPNVKSLPWTKGT